MSESTRTAPSPRWGERCLDVTRGSAVTAVAAVPFSSALTSVACAVMLAAWLASGQAGATIGASLRQPLGIALAVFLGLAAAATLYSPAPWSDRLDILWGWRRFGYALILLGVFAPDAWKRRFVAVFLGAAGVGLIASFLSWLRIIGTKSGEFTGIVLQNHATQGIVFSLAILCAAHYARHASGRTRWALIAAMALFAGNIVFVTPGRSGYVALAVVAFAAAIMLYGWRRAWVWMPAGTGLAIVALTASPLVLDRIEQGWNEIAGAASSPAYTSMGSRMVLWSTSMELAIERPLIGHGTGSFGREYSTRVAGRYSDWRGAPGHDPHSQYLYIAVEMGLLGLAAFAAVLVVGFCSARAGPYGWIGGGALAVWCLTSLFSSHFRTFPEGHLIGLFLGAMLAAPGPVVASRSQRP